MNDFKDNVTNRERRYVFSVGLMFLLGFGLFMLQFVFDIDAQFDIDGHSGMFINILGAVITGYSLSAECSIIHYLLQAIRKGSAAIKAILIILFLPAMLGGFVFSCIATIPYCCYTATKIKRIQTDNKGVLPKSKMVALIVFLAIDLLILLIYFITY